MEWIKHKKAADSARRHYQVDSGKDWPDDLSVHSADLQKVVMLPRMPGNKKAIFTKCVVAFHETFATVDTQPKRRTQQITKKKKSLSVVWHEGIAGEITSAFTRALTHRTEVKKQPPALV